MDVLNDVLSDFLKLSLPRKSSRCYLCSRADLGHDGYSLWGEANDMALYKTTAKGQTYIWKDGKFVKLVGAALLAYRRASHSL